ncbi:ATP-binding protein [Nocardia sp. NPDC055321]
MNSASSHATTGDSTPGATDPYLMVKSVPAVAEHLPPLRAMLERWAHDAGLSQEQVLDVTLAAYEAMANVVDHAYRGRARPGDFDLEARIDHDATTITVTDHGKWRPRAAHTDSRRGRGLILIRALAPDTRISYHRGTRVHLSWPHT